MTAKTQKLQFVEMNESILAIRHGEKYHQQREINLEIDWIQVLVDVIG